MTERVMWYGLEKDGKRYRFRKLMEDPSGVLRDLRNGKTPEVENIPADVIPDLREITLKFARERIREEFTADQAIIKQVQFKKELDRIINLYYERILGFGIYFVEDAVKKDPCRLFREGAGRSVPSYLERILNEGRNLCDLRSVMVDSIRSSIMGIMPNTCSFAGPDIASELLERGGGLRRLAHLSSGAIQVMGAEKALFKHTSTGSPSPKHGLIFKYAGISSLPKEYRGKISRAVANKLAICIRADMVGGSVDAEEMKNRISREIERIRENRGRKKRVNSSRAHSA